MFRLDRFLTLYFFHPLIKFTGRGQNRIPILMYHSISDDSEAGVHPYYKLVTSPVRFREQMRFLYDNSFKVIGLEDAVTKLKADDFIKNNYVALTFDDGFHDFLTNALPILEELAFTATVFLPVNYIGANRKTFKNRDCLLWNEVRELINHGITFGSHTLSHPKLYGMKWEEIRCELKESRARLEDELQAPVSLFCYPYAFPQEDKSFVKRFRRELVEQGYRGAVTTAIGCSMLCCDPLYLPRLPINSCDDIRLFESKLDGAYDWLSVFQGIVRRTKSLHRSYRPIYS